MPHHNALATINSTLLVRLVDFEPGGGAEV